MQEQIISNLENPRQLELLYREHKAEFRQAFNTIYPHIRESVIAQTWYERINFSTDDISWGNRADLVFVLVASLLAGIVAKIPQLFSIDPEFFYPRNLSFIVFPFITAWFLRKGTVSKTHLWFITSVFAAPALYINLLPANPQSDTLILACIHLPLLLWAITGFAFAEGQWNNLRSRLGFLRYNGDLVVMTTIIMIAGGLLTAVTLGLFALIDLKIEQFYFEYIAVFGAAAAPVAGTWLVRTNPQLVNKVSPVIARIFTPLVLIMLVIYLAAVLYTGKDPYNDREFLMVFNLLLVGVMAIIFFTVAEWSRNTAGNTGMYMLLCLSVVTMVVNGIALSAILFRINEWGITPNRLAVLGANLLMLLHMLIITYNIVLALRRDAIAGRVEHAMVKYLPVYLVWVIIIVFLFPFVFGMK